MESNPELVRAKLKLEVATLHWTPAGNALASHETFTVPGYPFCGLMVNEIWLNAAGYAMKADGAVNAKSTIWYVNNRLCDFEESLPITVI